MLSQDWATYKQTPMMDGSDELLRDEPLCPTTDDLAVVPPDEHEREEGCIELGDAVDQSSRPQLFPCIGSDHSQKT